MSGVDYKPYEDRTPDYQYQNILRKILEEGVYKKHPHQTHGRYTLLTAPNMIFDLRNGVPLITERKIGFWRKPIAEIIGFLNGARTLEELEKYGGKHWPSWWSEWVDKDTCELFGLPEGDLGPGSYGPGFSRSNQVTRLVEQIKRAPDMSTHVLDPWQPDLALQDRDGKRRVVVAPCHGWIQVTILDSTLHLRMDQRSADMPIGVPSNMIQYAALTLMFAQVTGYKPGMFIHSVHDAQIYENQIEKVEEVLKRKPLPFPTLRITEPDIDNILDFRAEHFELLDYYPHPAMNDIPVTK